MGLLFPQVRLLSQQKDDLRSRARRTPATFLALEQCGKDCLSAVSARAEREGTSGFVYSNTGRNRLCPITRPQQRALLRSGSAAQMSSIPGLFPRVIRDSRYGRKPCPHLPPAAGAGDARLRSDPHPTPAPDYGTAKKVCRPILTEYLHSCPTRATGINDQDTILSGVIRRPNGELLHRQ